MTSYNSLIEAASELAYFILNEKEAAEASTIVAIARLNVAATAQSRRYYYVPGVSAKAYGVRTKITLSDSHLLQRLIYEETEAYERRQELGGALDERRLLTHFIKHLVWSTVKRNSFYVTLGISRLLHCYTNQEAMELHGVVMQNPARVKEYDYWRSRKGRLMKEVKARFGELIAITRRAHNEERFVARDDSAAHAAFIHECLRKLMPWNTACPLPAGTEAVRSPIPSLDFNGDDPDAEHQVEIARIHAVLHAECFARLMAGLKFAAPDSRLEVPLFFRTGGNDPNTDEKHDMTQEKEMVHPDLNTIQTKLIEHQQLLDRIKPERLQLMAGRRQCGTLDLRAGSQATFTLDEADDYIELRAPNEEGGMSLALCPIDFVRLKHAGNSDTFTLSLADGRKLKFTITPQRDEYDEVTGATVLVSYQSSPWQFWKRRFSSFLTPSGSTFSYAAATALILIGLVIGLIVWRMLQTDSSEQTVAVSLPPSGTASVRPSPYVTVAPSAIPQTSPNSGPPAGRQVPTNGGASDKINPHAVRDPDVAGTAAVKALSEVNRIFIAIENNTPAAQAIQQQLERQLNAGGRWESALRENTDAALNVVIKPNGQTYAFQMVNAKGAIIWPGKRKWKTYSGDAEQVAKLLIDDLTKAARR